MRQRWIDFFDRRLAVAKDDDMAISKGAGYQAAKPHLLLPTRPRRGELAAVAFHLIDEKLRAGEDVNTLWSPQRPLPGIHSYRSAIRDSRIAASANEVVRYAHFLAVSMPAL